MDLILRTHVYLSVALSTLRDRFESERGAAASEYVGILVIVGAIILAITTANIPSRVTSALSTALNQIFGGGGGGAPAGGQ